MSDQSRARRTSPVHIHCYLPDDVDVWSAREANERKQEEHKRHRILLLLGTVSLVLCSVWTGESAREVKEDIQGAPLLHPIITPSLPNRDPQRLYSHRLMMFFPDQRGRKASKQERKRFFMRTSRIVRGSIALVVVCLSLGFGVLVLVPGGVSARAPEHHHRSPTQGVNQTHSRPTTSGQGNMSWPGPGGQTSVLGSSTTSGTGCITLITPTSCP